MSRLSDFVHCVVDPFGHSGALTGVPDRFNGVSVVVENRTTKTLNLSASSDTLVLVTDWPGANLNYGVGNGDNLSTFKKKLTNVQAVMSTQSLIDAFEKYRTMALAVRVISIGPPFQSAGLITVGLVPLQVQYKGNGIYSTNVNRVVSVEDVPLSVDALNAQPDSVQFRLVDGVMAVSKHSAGDSWNFAEMDLPALVCSGVDLKPAKDGKPQDISSDILFTSSPFAGSDGNSYAIAIRITGSNAESSVQVEVVHCMEILPMAGPFKALARPSPPADPAELDSLSRIQRSAPAGISAAQEPSWTQILKAGAIGAGRLVGGLAERFLGLNLGGRQSAARSTYPAIMW